MSLFPGEQDRTFPDDRPLSQQPRWRQDFLTDIAADDAPGGSSRNSWC